MIKAAWERLRQSMALYLRFAELLREHRFAMGLVLSLVLATVALELLKPWPIQWIIDSALIGEPTGGLTRADIILRGALMAAVCIAGFGYWLML